MQTEELGQPLGATSSPGAGLDRSWPGKFPDLTDAAQTQKRHGELATVRHVCGHPDEPDEPDHLRARGRAFQFSHHLCHANRSKRCRGRSRGPGPARWFVRLGSASREPGASRAPLRVRWIKVGFWPSVLGPSLGTWGRRDRRGNRRGFHVLLMPARGRALVNGRWVWRRPGVGAGAGADWFWPFGEIVEDAEKSRC